MATTTNGIHIKQDGIVSILRMHSQTNNSIDRHFIDHITDCFATLKEDAQCKAVILTSGHAKLFSPGLDLFQCYDYDRAQMTEFFTAFIQLYHLMFDFPKPVIAAINGHAIAGGFCLSLAADYRILKAENALVGLNELKVGVILPYGIVQMLQAAVSPNVAREIAYFGNNYNAQEALKLGIVDEICPESDIHALSLERAKTLAEKPSEAFAETKQYLRKDYSERMHALDLKKMDRFLDIWFSPETRARLHAVIQSIQKK